MLLPMDAEHRATAFFEPAVILVEGRLRFWAWMIARGAHEPIAALEV